MELLVLFSIHFKLIEVEPKDAILNRLFLIFLPQFSFEIKIPFKKRSVLYIPIVLEVEIGEQHSALVYEFIITFFFLSVMRRWHLQTWKPELISNRSAPLPRSTWKVYQTITSQCYASTKIKSGFLNGLWIFSSLHFSLTISWCLFLKKKQAEKWTEIKTC